MTQAETPVAQLLIEVQPTGAPAIADHGALQGLGDDDHPQYLTGQRAAAIFAQQTVVAALETTVAGKEAAGAAVVAITEHINTPDPHPQYLTHAEGDARYPLATAVAAALDEKEAVGTAAASMDAHTGAANPHPEYQTQSAVDALIEAAVGVSVQAYNATLAALSGLATQAFGRDLLNMASAAALRTTIALPTSTTAGRLARYTDAAGSQSQTAGLYEDAAGNVGIGTISPVRKLEVAVGGTLTGQNGYAGGTAAVFRSTASSASNCRASITAGNAGVSIIDFGDTDGDRGALAYYHPSDSMDLMVNAATRLRIDSSGRVGLGNITPTATLDNPSDTYRQRNARTPASASAAGNAGDICWDANFLYVCVATNTWKRATLSTW